MTNCFTLYFICQIYINEFHFKIHRNWIKASEETAQV